MNFSTYFITCSTRVYMWVFFLFFLIGCNRLPNDLVEIEKIIDKEPHKGYELLLANKKKLMTNKSDTAFFYFLYFKACQKNSQILTNYSDIDKSIAYYSEVGDKRKLATCYYIKAYYLKYNQHLSDACHFYLKSRALAETVNDPLLIAKITYDLANVGFLKADYKYAFDKSSLAIRLFERLGMAYEISHSKVCLARYYRIKKNFATSIGILNKIPDNDSILKGVVLQELALNYYALHKYNVSRQYFLESLKYPYYGTNFSIRNFSYADLLFDMNNFDSANYYASRSFMYFGSYYGRRDASRIIANCAFIQHDLKRMNVYISKYQDYTDSIRTIESQEKPSLIETVYSQSKETEHSNHLLFIVVVFIIVLVFLGMIFGYKFYKKRQIEGQLLDDYKKQLNQKNELLAQKLVDKIEHARKQQASARKKATPEQKVVLDKQLYVANLNLENWEAFSCEMNHTFNQIIHDLETNYSGVSKKEIIWCCLELLNVPANDRLVILDVTSDSMYKLKQRLASKLNGKSAKDVDLFLNTYKMAQNWA